MDQSWLGMVVGTIVLVIAAASVVAHYRRGKRHHVFFTVLPDDARAEPSNEILRCRWFRPRKVATLITTVPTREIVNLLFGDERM